VFFDSIRYLILMTEVKIVIRAADFVISFHTIPLDSRYNNSNNKMLYTFVYVGFDFVMVRFIGTMDPLQYFIGTIDPLQTVGTINLHVIGCNLVILAN